MVAAGEARLLCYAGASDPQDELTEEEWARLLLPAGGLGGPGADEELGQEDAAASAGNDYLEDLPTNDDVDLPGVRIETSPLSVDAPAPPAPTPSYGTT